MLLVDHTLISSGCVMEKLKKNTPTHLKTKVKAFTNFGRKLKGSTFQMLL
jgi:hypothetical protein